MKKRANETGQTLMELIVVVTVSILVVGALVFATIASLRNAQFSKNQSQATKLAQGGMELVRTARDRNKSISGFVIGPNNVTSWNGNGGVCASNPNSIWCNRITSNCGSATQYCFFNITSQSVLNYIGPSTGVPGGAEPQGLFKRAIIVADDTATYQIQKTVTAVVTWTDFSGPHESRLTTILRKI